MTTTNGWPGKPGVPLNPERPGKHWLRSPGGEIYLSVWYVTANPNHSFWEKGPGWSSPEAIARSGWTYLGPALMPDEVAKREDAKWHEGYAVGVLDVRRGTAFGEPDPHYAALQKRVAELEGALKDAAASVKEWGAYASAYLQDKWDLPGEVARYIAIAEGKNDAALEGGKE